MLNFVLYEWQLPRNVLPLHLRSYREVNICLYFVTSEVRAELCRNHALMTLS